MRNDASFRRRFLRFESLETRALLAADVQLLHNFAMPEDCDDSGLVSPLDALIVINELNRPEAVSAVDATKMLDVNADGLLSPLDALVVINYLNRQPPNGDATPSFVPIQARIARLESAIANGQLPIALGSDGAQELLQTLKNGGRPELGERFIEGRVHPRNEVEQFETERIAIELAPQVRDEEHANRFAEFLDRFSTKLRSAGINAQVIDTLTSEIKSGNDAGTPLSLTQIKMRLTELGVDFSKLFPIRPETPAQLEPQIQAVIQRLRTAGINAEVITKIVSDFRTSVHAGTPFNFEQIVARLTELGVDVAKLFPPAQPTIPTRWTPSVELVTSILRRVNAKPESIESIRTAMIAAKEAGSPLSLSQILSLLRPNGIQNTESIARLLRPVR